MELQFIDHNTRLDRTTQKRIRSHAMKGKNLGKIIPARGVKHRECKQAALQRREEAEQGHIHGSQQGEVIGQETRNPLFLTATSVNALPLPNPFSGEELSFLAFPVRITPSVRYLLYELHYSIHNELYPSDFCRWPKASEASWFEYMIADPCVTHCVLAMIANHLSSYHDSSDGALASTWHFSQAISLLRRNLDTVAEPRDSSLAVIISLSIHAKTEGSLSESRIHLIGLKRALELQRGGLTVLPSRAMELSNKIRRADVELALLSGASTIFGAHPLPAAKYVVPLEAHESFITPYPLGETCATLQYVLRDVLALCSYAGQTHLDPYRYHSIITSIFQRLVDYAPLDSARPALAVDDLCQLSLLAFMTTIVYRVQKKRLAYSASLSSRLGMQLGVSDTSKMYEAASLYLPFRLWLLFIYALSSPHYTLFCETGSAVGKQIRAVAHCLYITHWEEVISYLKKYPWLAAFHDEPGRELWKSAIKEL